MRPNEWRLVVLTSAAHEIQHLPATVAPRLAARITSLASEPRPRGCTKLKGGRGFRLRVGSYRILYHVDDKQRTVTITAVGQRRDIYRKKRKRR